MTTVRNRTARRPRSGRLGLDLVELLSWMRHWLLLVVLQPYWMPHHVVLYLNVVFMWFTVVVSGATALLNATSCCAVSECCIHVIYCCCLWCCSPIECRILCCIWMLYLNVVSLLCIWSGNHAKLFAETGTGNRSSIWLVIICLGGSGSAKAFQ